jgi:hypothetical protein
MRIFSRNKRKEAAEDLCYMAVEPLLVDTLRKRRSAKIREANELDRQRVEATVQLERDIASLDEEITYLERHPGSDAVLKEFIRQEKGS